MTFESSGNQIHLSRKVVLKNKRGLHARASSKIHAIANSYDAQIFVCNGERRANGDEIMDLMTLNAPLGTELTLETIGPDADLALDTLVKMVEDRFGEGE